MKYDIAYSCGHQGTVNLVGPVRDRESKIKWYERSAVCPDCYQAQLAETKAKKDAERAEAAEAAAENAAQMGYPALEGSEKQVEWAMTIRQNFVDYCNEQIAEYVEDGKEDEIRSIMALYIDSLKTAREWIDNRDENPGVLLNRFKHVQKNAAPKMEIKPIASPETVKHGGTAVITFNDGTVSAKYERNDSFIAIAKGLDFAWSGNAWTKKDIIDRAAELTAKLLEAGFSVQSEQDIIDRAASGNYEPECKLWVKARTAGTYDGWFLISFPRGSDKIYTAARRITGSKWDNGSVIAPSGSYLEVEDFADLYGFKLSPGATKLVEAAKAAVSITAVASKAKKEQNKLNDILNSSTEVIEDLKD